MLYDAFPGAYHPRFQLLLLADGPATPTAAAEGIEHRSFSTTILFDSRAFQRYSQLSRVFGRYPVELDSAPRDTTLKRAILDLMETGGRMRSASGFMLISDLNWGGQV
jgi:hypothetical protein